jgi:arylformamidase
VSPRILYDISVSLGAGVVDYPVVDYPGDMPHERSLIMQLENGDFCDLSRLVMSTHSGTHLDAPPHFIHGARTIHASDPCEFVPPCRRGHSTRYSSR